MPIAAAPDGKRRTDDNEDGHYEAMGYPRCDRGQRWMNAQIGDVVKDDGLKILGEQSVRREIKQDDTGRKQEAEGSARNERKFPMRIGAAIQCVEHAEEQRRFCDG